MHSNKFLRTFEVRIYLFIILTNKDIVFILHVGSQIILSTILAIQNNNHTQEHKIYMENPFSLKGKIMEETQNQFTIIKSITIILMYVSRLKKNLFYFSLLLHTLIISFKDGNTLLSYFYFLGFSRVNIFSFWIWLENIKRQPFCHNF